MRRVSTKLRVAVYVAVVALTAVITAAITTAAVGQTTPAAREVTLAFPEGYVYQHGTNITFSPAFVDAVVRTQGIDYLQAVANGMKPQVPAGMKIGVVVGKAFDPGCAASVYLSGWVVERATRVDVTVDASVPMPVVPTVTMAGYPKTWKWCVPEKYHDGKDHKAYLRAMNGTTLIGPLDNAAALNRYVFNIPAAAPAPVPPPVVAPPFVNGRVTYAAGVVTVEAAPEYTRAELLIDSRDVAPWYLGVKTFAGGVATFAVPPAARDGAEHLLDVRLYKADLPGVFRPDGYPIRATLTP